MYYYIETNNDKELCKLVQDKLFELGFRWGRYTSDKIAKGYQHIDATIIGIDFYDKTILFGDNARAPQKYQKVSFADLYSQRILTESKIIHKKDEQ